MQNNLNHELSKLPARYRAMAERAIIGLSEDEAVTRIQTLISALYNATPPTPLVQEVRRKTTTAIRQRSGIQIGQPFLRRAALQATRRQRACGERI